MMIYPCFFTEDEEYFEKKENIKEEDFILANDHELETELDDYQRGYLNALSSQNRRISLRGRDVSINPIQKRASQQKDTQTKHNPPRNQSKGK